MKTLKNGILFFLFFILSIATSHAQSIDVSATIDSSSMRIGEQRHIRLQVIQPQSAVVHFPIVSQSDTLVEGVEILAASKLDTTKVSGAIVKISQEILVTAFDSGRYVIPPFKFSSKIKEFETEKIFLDVATVNADFDHASITDINENYDPGFNWKRFFLYLSILLIITALAYIGYLAHTEYRRRKKEENETKPIEDNRLPHEIAIAELDVIKEEKVWKNGFTKQYYTSITDTLREYFIKRFNISAMEMTSSEIVDSLKYNSDAAPIMDKMKQIFTTSDMVKFAKQEPSQEENEMSILHAYQIVNETIVIPAETEGTISTDSSTKKGNDNEQN